MLKLHVAVLVDLPREAASGGHVKYWERIAQAAAQEDLPLDLTVYFSGTQKDESLSSSVRYRFLPPVFSTARLKFLPYVPAHTDLASFHPRLAEELPKYDVIHTTEGFFAFARTAERVARWNQTPLTTSFHTDTPAYAEVFTQETIRSLLGKRFGGWLDGFFRISMQERASKTRRLRTHLKNCAAILAMRAEDIILAQNVAGKDKIKPMRLGVDKKLFAPQLSAREAIQQEYAIPAEKFLVLFVGRIDAGKNAHILIQACADALAQGTELHLLMAGLGPISEEAQAKLGSHVTLAGFVEPQKLAQFYAAADCLAIASDIEIGGMIGVEALACGCPVLVTRQNRMAEICGNPPAMQNVESGITPWTQALLGLTNNKEKQTFLHEAALAFRQNNLASWGDVLKEDFLSVWQQVAAEKKHVR